MSVRHISQLISSAKSSIQGFAVINFYELLMSKQHLNRTSKIFQITVSVFGLAIWGAAAFSLSLGSDRTRLLISLALVPLLFLSSLFINTFQLSVGQIVARSRLTCTLSDSVILLVAYGCGAPPAIFLAGIEAFFSTRRTSGLPTSLFSMSVMSLAAACAVISLDAVLAASDLFFVPHTLAVAAALLVGSLVQLFVNILFISVIIALRQNTGIKQLLAEQLTHTAPLLLPTSAAANLLFLTYNYNLWLPVIVTVPVFAAIYFSVWHYRHNVELRVSIMEKAHRETIEALAAAINAKDQVTHEHVLRVQIYASGVARLMDCTEEEIEALKAGALLHDIGKIAVPDSILNKPGKLTRAEFERMKMHTLAGAQILSRVEFPFPVVPIVRSHHERWDGGGYPDGLQGEEIPLTARILSVVDCFDAVREDRQYREGLTRAEAIELIFKGSGTQYDPRVVGVFLANLPLFEAEILARRKLPVARQIFVPSETLSDAAKAVSPAAGLAEDDPLCAEPEELIFHISHSDENSLWTH